MIIREVSGNNLFYTGLINQITMDKKRVSVYGQFFPIAVLKTFAILYAEVVFPVPLILRKISATDNYDHACPTTDHWYQRAFQHCL